MKQSKIVNPDEIKKSIDVLKPNHQLFEIRILGSNKRNVLSGYFTDSDTLLEAFDTVDLRNTNVYITLNALNNALYSRIQHDKFVANPNTTSDTEVTSYQWLFIDLDPVRPANISSSDEELSAAEKLKETIKEHLAEIGFPAPVEALSGNGFHLLYRIDLPVNDKNIQLVSDCLSTLAALFNNSDVKVDTTNCNPSRICKLHGTLAQKGANTKERPFRMSRIIACPEPVEIVSREMLEQLVGKMPEHPEEVKKMSPASRQVQQAFDIKDFMTRHGMTYKEDTGRDCQIYLLDECPFDHNHRNGDSKIFAYTNGAIAFKCHHNSCKGKKWQDVRTLFEPEAYEWQHEEERIEDGYEAHKKIKKKKEDDPEIPLPGDAKPARKKRKKEEIKPLYSAAYLMKQHYDPPKIIVGVGSEEPMLVEGTCILSAKPKLGKSWFAMSMGIAVARGDDFLGYKTEQCDVLYLDLEASEQVQQTRMTKALAELDAPENFYFGKQARTLDDGFIDQLEGYLNDNPKIGLVIIDIFQKIRSQPTSFKEQEYAHAYRDITPLNEVAEKWHISIILICHDRKMVDFDDPFSNILGSIGLQGAVAQMIVMFRKKAHSPIHISIKGRTIDALPELDVQLNRGIWTRCDLAGEKDPELLELDMAYKDSVIRKAVITIAEHGTWKGRCSALIERAEDLGIKYLDTDVTPKMVGGFLNKHKSRFEKYDRVGIDIIKNGEAGKLYRISKLPLMTVDGTGDIPLMVWEEASDYEVPFDIAL